MDSIPAWAKLLSTKNRKRQPYTATRLAKVMQKARTTREDKAKNRHHGQDAEHHDGREEAFACSDRKGDEHDQHCRQQQLPGMAPCSRLLACVYSLHWAFSGSGARERHLCRSPRASRLRTGIRARAYVHRRPLPEDPRLAPPPPAEAAGRR